MAPRYHVALDVGTKTIGVARAPANGPAIASPQFTLRREGLKKDIPRILQAIAAWGETGTLVVGMPFELDGSEGRSARLARQVGEALAATGATVVYQDERFSTVEAGRRLSFGGKDTRQQKDIIDSAAAAVILEDWLAKDRNQKTPPAPSE